MYIKMRDISKEDELLLEIPFVIKDKAKDGDLLSVQNIKIMESEKYGIYYIFEHKFGKALTNYNVNEYEEIEKVIRIDNSTLFQFAYGRLQEISHGNMFKSK